MSSTYFAVDRNLLLNLYLNLKVDIYTSIDNLHQPGVLAVIPLPRLHITGCWPLRPDHLIAIEQAEWVEGLF